MKDRKEVINEYYNNYDEDNRLAKDHTHSLEFIVTKKYIGRYLKEDDKILEVGAGTGRDSLYYACKGFDVKSIEYTEHNLELLKSKIKDTMHIRAEQGDAVDLSRFDDNSFDVTLVLGPLYHLYDDRDIDKAIKEAVRVTKKEGIIAFAYISSDGVFANWGVDHLIDGYPNDFDDTFKMVRYPEGIFAPFYIEEFKKLMSRYNVTPLHNVSTDGIAYLIGDKINRLSDEEFNVWVKYQMSVCEREDLQGYSCHMLYICRKK